MRKIISIDRTENFTIKLFNHNLFVFNDYIIYRADFSSLPVVEKKLMMRSISLENVELCIKGDFSMERMQKYLQEKGDETEGFLFFDGDEPVGYLWIMYKGGNHFQYRVRNIEALIYQIEVFPEFRGQGICGIMMCQAFEYLKTHKDINEAYWSVRNNNESALKAYNKLDANQVGRRRFFRILKINIPYCKI